MTDLSNAIVELSERFVLSAGNTNDLLGLANLVAGAVKHDPQVIIKHSTLKRLSQPLGNLQRFIVSSARLLTWKCPRCAPNYE